MEVLMAWRATVPPTTFHCTPLLYEDCRQPVGWPSLLWRLPRQILCYLANDSCRHGCVTAVGNDLIWLNLSTIQAPNPKQLLENKHHMKIITSWHHAAEISSLHRQTDMADREGSDNTTNVSLSFARVRILKCELCPCTVMKKAQLEEWISSPWNKSPGRKIICLCASNNPSQPCLLTAPHLLLLPCLSCKLGELHGRGPHCLLTNTPFSRLGPHWWIIQALPSALLRFLIKVRR